MKRRTVVIVGLCAFVVATVALFPAIIIESPVNRALSLLATNPQLRNVSGTIWSGAALVQLKGSRASSQSQATPALDVPISWSFAPTSMLRLRIGLNVTATGRHLSGKTTVEAGMLSVNLRNTDLRLSIEGLSHLNGDIAVLRPSGDVQFISDGHTLQINYASSHEMAGRLSFAVNRFRVRAIGGVPLGAPLGSYRGHLIFNGQRIVYQIETSSGLLSLIGGGHVVLGKPNEFHYQGFGAALPGSPSWLANTIGTLGRATPDGRVSIDYKTNW